MYVKIFHPGIYSPDPKIDIIPVDGCVLFIPIHTESVARNHALTTLVHKEGRKRRVKSTQQPKWVKIDIKPSYILLKKASSITLLLSKDGGLGRRGGTLFIGLNGSEFKTNCLGWIIEFVKSHPHWRCGKKRRTDVAKASCKSQCFTAK